MKTKKCRMLHGWTRVPVCSIHVYQECSRCGARRVLQASPVAGYEPVDSHWLQTGEWLASSATYGMASNGTDAQPVTLNLVFPAVANQPEARPLPLERSNPAPTRPPQPKF